MEKFHLTASTQTETEQCARALAACLQCGEWVSLCGIVGAGKTHFARAAIQHLVGADEVVPSPSFTLVQYYGALLHADFYRIADPQEIPELGVSEDLATHISFIEWAAHAGDLLPAPDYIVSLAIPEGGVGEAGEAEEAGEEVRTITIEASPPRIAALRQQLQRENAIEAFLATAGFGTHSRHTIAGDASGRRYSRLAQGQDSTILMDWAVGLDTQERYNGGLDYVRAARLAEDTPALCRILRHLAPHINVATIYAADEAAGLMLCQDFGGVTLATLPAAARAPVYLEAIETLCALHKLDAPDFLPAYDGAVCANEAALFVDWYLPYCGIAINEEARRAWQQLWQDLGTQLAQSTPRIILRDYHSVNLHWLPDAAQIYRLGVIDVQDALRGTPAYDVVSLLQDARIDVAPAQEAASLAHYLAQAGHDKKTEADFLSAYAICGAQRNFKIAGIFVRLAQRDDKPHYLEHLPRILDYLKRNLREGHLQPVVAWLNEYAPQTQLTGDTNDA